MSNRSQSPTSSRLGTAPVGPLLVRLAIPMMISMLVQALYNIVDSFYVSHIAEEALSALTLAFPIQSLMIAFAVGTGVGVNAHLSKSLGEGNQEEAERAAMNGIFLSLCTCAVFCLGGLFLSGPFIRAQTPDETIRAYGVDYLSIVTVWSLGIFVQCMVEKLLTATGRTTSSMFTQLLGALTNIILDPILIFGLFGAPQLGVAGAAIATVAGQWLGAGAGILLNLFKNPDLHFRLRYFPPSAYTLRRIYAVGVPSIAMSAIGSLMNFCMNNILINFSGTAVAVFGAYFKLQSFIFMPVFGLNSGMVPLISYNYGARKPKRILQAFQLGVLIATGIMLCGMAIAQLAPRTLLRLFDADENMMNLGEVALRTISLHFVFAGFNIVSTATFQALGRGVLALWGSVVRQIVVLIPTAWLFSLSGNVNRVWWAFPCAEFVSTILCGAFLYDCWKKIIKPMLQEEAAQGDLYEMQT